MKLTIEIFTESDAFQISESDRAAELTAVLQSAEFAARCNRNAALDWESKLYDSNGNHCGSIRAKICALLLDEPPRRGGKS